MYNSVRVCTVCATLEGDFSTIITNQNWGKLWGNPKNIGGTATAFTKELEDKP